MSSSYFTPQNKQKIFLIKNEKKKTRLNGQVNISRFSIIVGTLFFFHSVISFMIIFHIKHIFHPLKNILISMIVGYLLYHPKLLLYIYSSQHLKGIKKVNQSCPKTRTGIVLVLAQLWWKVLIHFKCWLLYVCVCCEFIYIQYLDLWWCCNIIYNI